MADKITLNALDEQDGVRGTDPIGKDVPTTDAIVRAGGDFLYLKMAGMIHVNDAIIAAIQKGDFAGAVSEATTTTAGIVKKAATQANSTATDVAGLVADFNSLLAKLKAAGLM